MGLEKNVIVSNVCHKGDPSKEIMAAKYESGSWGYWLVRDFGGRRRPTNDEAHAHKADRGELFVLQDIK